MKLRRLEDDKVAKSTVDKNASVAKSFFNWRINQGITNSNPVKKVKLFHAPSASRLNGEAMRAPRGNSFPITGLLCGLFSYMKKRTDA